MTKTLVCIEDDSDIRRLLELVFGARYEVETFASGLEGVQRLGADPRPVAVILDLGLPDISGLEVLGRLRSDESTRHLPVLVLSAGARRASLEEAMDQGADLFLSKPFDLAELEKALEELVRSKHPG